MTRGGRRGLLERIAGFSVRRRRVVILVWLALLVVAGYFGALSKQDLSNNFTIPGAGSQQAYDLLEQRFGSQNAASTIVVFTVPEGRTIAEAGTTISGIVTDIANLPGVTNATDPLNTPPVSGLPPTVSPSGRVAYSTVTYDKPLPELVAKYGVRADEHVGDYRNPYSQLARVVRQAEGSGISVSIGGPIADTWNQPVSWWANHADEVGLILGAILLLIAFGSLFGMALPIATALFGAGTASGLVFILAKYVTVSSAVPPVTLMISLGVGLDYSLLIVTRYRQFLRDGMDPHEAVATAMATAGRASVFAGITVCIAMLGLVVVPLPLVQVMGIGAAVGVATTVLAATTFLPALLGVAGRKIDAVRIPFLGREREDDPHHTFWGRVALGVTRRPWWALVLGTVVLLLLAAPFLRIEYGMPDDSSLPRDLSQRVAFVQTTRAFGAGTNGPLLVAVAVPRDKVGPFSEVVGELTPLSNALAALEPPGTLRGVKYSVGPIPNDVDRTTAVIYTITPTTAPDSEATAALVDRLRSTLAKVGPQVGVEAYVGGTTATLIDLTDLVARYLPWVVGAVVLGAFILLILVFRSVLVPLKAAIMNLLSIGAAYGVVVAVFQWGWFKGLVGLEATIPIVSFVPLIMFVILFGLSMDYEVFLMSRIHEEWKRDENPRESVVLGVSNTARVITTAAMIMIVVFGSFVATSNPTVKLIGFGMAVAVLIDSSLLRMVLVPAVMRILGRAAWWFPPWLEWLPHLDLDEAPPEASTTPAAH